MYLKSKGRDKTTYFIGLSRYSANVTNGFFTVADAGRIMRKSRHNICLYKETKK